MAAELNPIFIDADKAREHLESLLWPNGPLCPHCGNADPDRIVKLAGKAHRPGLYQCKECRDQFTVTVGTVFERSKIKLNTWLYATFLLNSSKKGMSAHQLHRMLGVTYKTAWFMCHRIREAMADAPGSVPPLGGEGKIVEADETYFGKKETQPKMRADGRPFIHKGGGPAGKRAVVALVERGGSVRSFHVDRATRENVRQILVTNVSRKSTLMTDTAGGYMGVGKEFESHEMVDHGIGEYVRGDAHSNTVEGYFSVLKRGITGVYHHVSEAHLKRYLAEFDFRYNNRSSLGVTDGERTANALKGIEGKRLTYRPTN